MYTIGLVFIDVCFNLEKVDCAKIKEPFNDGIGFKLIIIIFDYSYADKMQVCFDDG